MTDAIPYTVPKEPGRWRAITLAALVHMALFTFLWIGVRWQNETPATIEAEVWSPQQQEAAPVPEPVKAPEPKPEPQPVVKEPPKPKEIEPPVAKPDIALEQEKKRKAEEKKKREEEERLAKEKKRLEEEKLAKLKEEKEKAEKAKKEAAEKKRKQEEADAKMLVKMREAEMGRLAGTGGSGEAPKSQGGRASAEYGARIAAKIKSNTIYVVPENLAGNPAVEYAVDLLPDGSLRSIPRKLKSSGIAGFDEAVLRAIEKSQPFPRDDKTGSVPSSVTVSHKPKDQ
jgi:colicin import membrane protein